MFRSKERTWKRLTIAMVAVLAFSVMAGCGKKDESKDAENSDNSAVVATYEGGQITENEFDRELRIVLALQPTMEQFTQLDDFREYLIKQEIAYKYLESKADDKTKAEGKKKADEQYKAMKEAYGEDQFKAMLDAQKVTEKEFQNYMVRVYTVMEGQLNLVTDEEVKAEFEATKDDFTTASVRHILIGLQDAEGNEKYTLEEALKVANEVKAKLDKGEDFATLAKEYSTDGGSNANGGLYENAKVSQWVEEFKQAALTQPLNEIGKPVETAYGYHIIRVESRNEKTFETLTDEEKETVKTTVASNKLDEFMNGELETKIIKEIKLPKVEKAADTTEGTEGTEDKDGATTPDTGTNTGTEETDTNTNSAK